MSSFVRRLTVIVFVNVLMLATACSARTIDLIQSDTNYTPETIASIADQVGAPKALGQPVENAEELRHDALSTLRSMGDEGPEIADLLTEQFPGPTRSVPFYVEHASFEGTDAWIVVEVWGSEGGKLDQTRIWAFETSDSRVLFTRAVN